MSSTNRVVCPLAFIITVITLLLINENNNRFGITTPLQNKPKVLERIECDVFVMVMSRASNTERQQLIRDTWASRIPKTIRLKFFVGHSTANTIDDMAILNDYVDEYRSLNIKTIKSLQWTLNRYNPRFVFKIDDDAYLNLDLLVQKIKTWPSTMLYLGYKMEGMPVIRDPTHPNADIQMPLSIQTYPPYHSGCGYVMSRDIANFLAYSLLAPRHITANEDTMIGLALVYSNVTIQHEDTIFPYPMPHLKCYEPSRVLLSHYVSEERIRQLHANISANMQVCG